MPGRPKDGPGTKERGGVSDYVKKAAEGGGEGGGCIWPPRITAPYLLSRTIMLHSYEWKQGFMYEKANYIT